MKIWIRYIKSGSFGSERPICWRKSIKGKKRKNNLFFPQPCNLFCSRATNHSYIGRSIDTVVEKLRAELEQLDRAVLEHQMKLNTAKAAAIKTEKDVSLVILNFAKKR